MSGTEQDPLAIGLILAICQPDNNQWYCMCALRRQRHKPRKFILNYAVQTINTKLNEFGCRQKSTPIDDLRAI